MVRAGPCLAVFLIQVAGALWCRSLPAQQPARQPPVLTTFAINGGADGVSSLEPVVSLDHTVVGLTPSEYRVSHRADFADARWLPYVPRPTLSQWFDAESKSCDPATASHSITLFLQVRAVIGEEMRVVAGQRQLLPVRVESNVLRDVICARVPRSGADHRGITEYGW
jgi:hypothetical protein